MDYPAPVIMIDGNGESSLCKYSNHTSSRRVCSDLSEISSGLDVDVDVAMASAVQHSAINICTDKRFVHYFLVLIFRLKIISTPLSSSEGDLALSKDAYAQRIGFFDKVAINYGYRIFTESGEDLLLQRLVDDAEAEGYVFLTDQVESRFHNVAAQLKFVSMIFCVSPNTILIPLPLLFLYFSNVHSTPLQIICILLFSFPLLSLFRTLRPVKQTGGTQK